MSFRGNRRMQAFTPYDTKRCKSLIFNMVPAFQRGRVLRFTSKPKPFNASETNKNCLFVSLVFLFGNVDKTLPVPILHKLGGRALVKKLFQC